MEAFSKEDKKRLEEMPEFQRFLNWLDIKITGTEQKILATDPRETEALIKYQAQRQAYKNILYVKENE